MINSVREFSTPGVFHLPEEVLLLIIHYLDFKSLCK